ncbi:hypothetical protein ANOBCDAF_03348 [Pleomorphomonas sp. T1.2MG-36]|uniref:DNA cytosine methyltransferase n=1 Tax=Pleomorphomonas sp. T1.2MG-36 TaxID=3041167 RepID=UPI0024775D02|nr:DNA cytosine methyltransferase [Pleomorphomonas sp. T1.2MG-36]CAI9414986.1 hypothetical protein ANOBCDAF_03348 [Pleomorphomonas sp. T1.2MG-36]
MPAIFGVVDLFAGPGGLGEGFSSLEIEDHSPFRIGISVEKEESAHRTLRLRAFLRQYRIRHGRLPDSFLDFHAAIGREPDWVDVDREAWESAVSEARCIALGTTDARDAVDKAIQDLRRRVDDTILIGGPPCQAYSLVGRARAKGKRDYVPENDERHYLFREYISVLDRLRPAVFVMENVKGMLSSTIESRLVFEMLMEDLASLGSGSGRVYELRAIRVQDSRASLCEALQPSDFIIQAEEFGVPQRRHRVIIVGIRSDVASGIEGASIPVAQRLRTVADVIGTLPRVRSGLSRIEDGEDAWSLIVAAAADELARVHETDGEAGITLAFNLVAAQMEGEIPARTSSALPDGYGTSSDALLQWLECSELRALAQHETRAHMASDLGRYLFAAVFGKVRGVSPRAAEFPAMLSPNHRNWMSGDFNDRFRVQLANEPSTTITSHISKDGNYFIHPDASQCRSLTVREAARLQTFPDDYLFLGNRTQQYVQVGNAVPPWLARQIAGLVWQVLNTRHL